MTLKSGAKDVFHKILTTETWWSVCLRLALILMAAFGLVVVLDPAMRALPSFGLLWRNTLPVALFALLMYGLSRRVLFSIWITAALAWVVFTINAIKQRNMNMPLMPGDIALEHQITHNLAFFSEYASHGLLAALGVVCFAIVTWAIWRVERNGARPSRATRLIWILVPAVMIYMMYSGVRPWGEVYSNKMLAGFQLWAPGESVNRAGLMAGLVRMTQEAKVKLPVADEDVVTTFAKRHVDALKERNNRVPPQVLPDIVVVQSEAFFDPEIMKGVEPNQFVPNFERLSKTGINGAMLAPTYGGGTIRTEFETLTGYPVRAFPSIVYPYYGLAANWMPTVPRRLQSFGYSTTLFHPFLSSFWNRQEVMPELGFQRSYYQSAFSKSKRAGLYVSDRALFKFVLTHLQKESDTPQFVMAITMENHGPWGRDAGALASIMDDHKLPVGLSAAGKQEMTYYLSHLVNGDEALGDFAKQLMARPRWTILVFYGDHLPALDNAFHELGFDDGGKHGTQRTRYMLLSNRTLKARKVDIDAYELPGLLFDTIGLPMDGYLAFDGAVRQIEAERSTQDEAGYGQVLYNAARMEVSCQSKISLNGACGKHVRGKVVLPEKGAAEVAASSASSAAQDAPVLDDSCGSSDCSNDELQADPAQIADCGANTSPVAVTVHWNAPDAKDGVVQIWIHTPGSNGPPTLWARKATPGNAVTGKWMLPGTQLILTNGSDIQKLSVLTLGVGKCDR